MNEFKGKLKCDHVHHFTVENPSASRKERTQIQIPNKKLTHKVKNLRTRIPNQTHDHKVLRVFLDKGSGSRDVEDSVRDVASWVETRIFITLHWLGELSIQPIVNCYSHSVIYNYMISYFGRALPAVAGHVDPAMSHPQAELSSDASASEPIALSSSSGCEVSFLFCTFI